jgi:hypothetical protein
MQHPPQRNNFLLQLGDFVGPYPHMDKSCHIGSNFCSFYLLKIGFTLSESVYLMKMFKLLRLKWVFFFIQNVDIVGGFSEKI